MVEAHPVGGPIAGRPWRSPGYGLGIMVDDASPRGRCMGHTGGGPGSVAASFHFADLRPTKTVAAFAPVEEAGVAGRAGLGRRGVGVRYVGRIRGRRRRSTLG